MHYGEDTVGAGNIAPVTGSVVFAGYDSSGAGFGNAVGVREARSDGLVVVWWMAHFASLAVVVGQAVTEGQYLGKLGSTGAATGPHVHTERRAGGAARPLTGVATNPRSHYTGTAGGGGTPFEQGEQTVIIYRASSTSKDGIIIKGMGYIQEGGLGYLRPLSSLEDGVYVYWAERGIPYRVAPWSGDDIRKLTASVGVMQMSNNPIADGSLTPQLTGRIIYADPAKADYPRTAGGGGSAPTAAENADAVATKLAPAFDAVPTAKENGDAARAAIVK